MLLPLVFALFVSAFVEVSSSALLAEYFGGSPGFYHSVASGDPLPNAVIIWTRYTPTTDDAEVVLEFRMAEVDPGIDADAYLDPSMNPNIIQAYVEVVPSSDWVVKLDVKGLKSDTQYVYAFTDGIRSSDVGVTRTAPTEGQSVTELKYAVFSGADFVRGYFHAYDIASTIEELDLWIHTGDYIYEYDVSESDPRSDTIEPKFEVVDLADYRIRHASYVHGDEGLRNLRRSVPMMASWNDHEIAENAWFNGALNHQPVCTTGTLSCTRDEGDVQTRWKNGFQAYMEWMPIRYQAGSMGQIDIGSFTQVIEWGDLATFITFDTRVSHRSEDPTVGLSPLASFVKFGSENLDHEKFYDTSTGAYRRMKNTEEEVLAVLRDPTFEMIGNDINLLEATVKTSSNNNKPWQIWAANTMMGSQILPDPWNLHKTLNASRKIKRKLKKYRYSLYLNNEGTTSATFRGLTAMAETKMPINRDGYDGFYFERSKILDIAKNYANNMIVLGGDVGNGYAYTLFEGGEVTGDNNNPVAVNLICPGVTSMGTIRSSLDYFYQPLIDKGFPQKRLEQAWSEASITQIPGLEYVDYWKQGFFAVSVTPTSHTAEYYLIDSKTIQTDYKTARQESGQMTAKYSCGKRLKTLAGEKGSLIASDDCNTITFNSERSSLLNIAVPVNSIGEVAVDVTSCGYMGCDLSP